MNNLQHAVLSCMSTISQGDLLEPSIKYVLSAYEVLGTR